MPKKTQKNPCCLAQKNGGLPPSGDGVLSEGEFVKGCLEDADLVGWLDLRNISVFILEVFLVISGKFSCYWCIREAFMVVF